MNSYAADACLMARRETGGRGMIRVDADFAIALFHNPIILFNDIQIFCHGQFDGPQIALKQAHAGPHELCA